MQGSSHVLNRESDHAFNAVALLLFVICSGWTLCGPMAAMSRMPMSRDWTMSMVWMRMPGQTWAAAATSFLAMWLPMMVTMMLPSLAPMLRRYREAIVGQAVSRRERMALVVAAGYFSVWMVFGLAVFPAGAILAAIAMRHSELARFVPLAMGSAVLVSGAFQFSEWKHRHLRQCREWEGCEQAEGAGYAAAWRHGLRLGLACNYCSAGFTAVLLAGGVMDTRLMLLTAAAITAERVATPARGVARAIGTVIAVAGLFMIARAIVVL